jgi:beta-phosphoglucomutase family hydrolase
VVTTPGRNHPLADIIPEGSSDVLGLPEAVHACLFDLDGVLTDTASVHTKAWKVMFDAFLRQRAQTTGEEFVPFDPVDDYRTYVDGKKREDGVRSFLASRGIELPDGDPDDPPGADTVYGLGTRKNDAFQETLHKDGVKVFDGSLRYLEKVAAAGLATAVVSSSANTREVLEITGLEKFIQQRVDGVTLREKHIAGKPAPDSYLYAAQLLDVAPAAAAVFEDALSGVESGRAGHFGYVVGVDRVGQADELRQHGADVVVTDLGDLL